MTSTTVGLFVANAFCNAPLISPGFSTRIAAHPIASATFAKLNSGRNFHMWSERPRGLLS